MIGFIMANIHSTSAKLLAVWVRVLHTRVRAVPTVEGRVATPPLKDDQGFWCVEELQCDSRVMQRPG